MFFNTTVSILVFNQISSTFIDDNILEFQDLKAGIKLRSTIYQTKMRFYHSSLNAKILNKDVFEKLIKLDLEGQITYIQDDLFRNFKDIRSIRFRMQVISNLFARRNSWLEHLNSDIDVDPAQPDAVYYYGSKNIVLVLNQLFSNLTFYDYPDEDICLFKNFPHRKLVWPLLMPNFKTKCSCTEIFLIQYSFAYYAKIFETIWHIDDL